MPRPRYIPPERDPDMPVKPLLDEHAEIRWRGEQSQAIPAIVVEAKRRGYQVARMRDTKTGEQVLILAGLGSRRLAERSAAG